MIMACLVALTSGVAALHAEVVECQVEFDIPLDQLALDKAPHDPDHLVAVELDDRLHHLDFCHAFHPRLRPVGAAGLGLLPAARIETAGRRDKPAKDAGDKGRGTCRGFCAQRCRDGCGRVKCGDAMLLLPKVYTPVTVFNNRLEILQGEPMVYRTAYFLGKIVVTVEMISGRYRRQSVLHNVIHRCGGFRRPTAIVQVDAPDAKLGWFGPRRSDAAEQDPRAVRRCDARAPE